MENTAQMNILAAASRSFYTLAIFVVTFTYCSNTFNVKLTMRTLIMSEMSAKVRCKLLYKMNLPFTKVL